MYRNGFIYCALLTASCVPSVTEVADTSGAGVATSEVAELTEPRSKPVKMPPRLENDGSSTGISIDDLFILQQSGGALIYDVRTPHFYGIDHIPGAVNWPHNQYEAQVQKRDIEIQTALNSGKKVVLYCFNTFCPEARNVSKKLVRRDYDVHVFTSGIDSWRDAGLPLETPSGEDPE